MFKQETAGSAWNPPQAEGSESIIPAREEGGADLQEHRGGSRKTVLYDGLNHGVVFILASDHIQAPMVSFEHFDANSCHSRGCRASLPEPAD